MVLYCIGSVASGVYLRRAIELLGRARGAPKLHHILIRIAFVNYKRAKYGYVYDGYTVRLYWTEGRDVLEYELPSTPTLQARTLVKVSVYVP